MTTFSQFIILDRKCHIVREMFEAPLFVHLFVGLKLRSIRSETHLGPDETRPKQNM